MTSTVARNPGLSYVHVYLCNSLPAKLAVQKEQREELKTLLKKYGNTWEPWRSELKKYRGEGKELIDA